jgi:hypothetical protein
LESIGIADGDGQLSHADPVRVTKLCVIEQWRLDPNHGQIRIGVLADEVSGVPTTIRQGDIDLIRALHDVAVRKGKAVRRKEEAGSAAGDTLRDTLTSG